MNKSKNIFWHIFPSAMGMVLFSIIVVYFLFSSFIRDFYVDLIRDRLETNAVVIRSAIINELKVLDNEAINTKIAVISASINTRITVVNKLGDVLGDSFTDPNEMKNHGDRPEIIEAIKGNHASSIRYSSTLTKETMYVAVPVFIREDVIGVVRTAVTVNSMYRVLKDVYRPIVLISALVGLLAIIYFFFIARKISIPLEHLKLNAAKLTQGDFDFVAPETTIGEVNQLSKSMDRMARSLKTNIKEITDSRNEFEVILSSLVEGVLAVDESNHIIFMNDSAWDILDVNIDPSGLLLEEVVRNLEMLRFVRDVSKESGHITKRIEWGGLSAKIFDVHGAALKGMKSDKTGALIVIHDVTKLVQLENMRKDFAANVSHELKTPLTAIIGATETLLGGVSEKDDLDRFLKIIHKHSERLNALINDIMSLSKIEQEAELNEIERCSEYVVDIVESALSACEEKADRENKKIEIDCIVKEKAFVNYAMIEQALVNLLDNAIKYSFDGETILLLARDTDTDLTIKVVNSGPGIPAESLPRLFERFYRVDAGRSRQEGGTGLGLSIVNHVIKAHGGKVDVQSELNGKTTFTIKLPII